MENENNMTEAAKIWEEIKGVQLDMFALPDQTVEKYCKPFMVDPTKLFVTLSASSAFTALESALGKKFTFEQAGKFIVISRKE